MTKRMMNQPDLLVHGLRYCPRCHKIKAIDQFQRKRNGDPQGYCKPCLRDYNARWYHAHPEQAKRLRRRLYERKIEHYRELSRVYQANLTPEAKATMLQRRRERWRNRTEEQREADRQYFRNRRLRLNTGISPGVTGDRI